MQKFMYLSQKYMFYQHMLLQSFDAKYSC